MTIAWPGLHAQENAEAACVAVEDLGTAAAAKRAGK
ncbi:hypothetical protein GGC64_006010 [Mycobacterium sp. OAS707]|nr:hypothetical protein [Mycobacterium sp. OAS707]